MLQEALADEHHARWFADYQRVEQARDNLAKEFAAVYPAMLAQAVDLFQRMAELDKECGRININAPYGEQRRQRDTELSARGLEQFTLSQPSIAKTCTLPEWEHSNQNAWPPPPVSMAAMAAFVAPPLPHRGPNWWMDVAARDEERRADAARSIADAAQRAREREERENAEVQAKIDAMRGGQH